MRTRSVMVLAAVILMAIIFGTQDAGARKIRTKLPTKKAAAAIATTSDSVSVNKAIINDTDSTGRFLEVRDKIRFYGFDKTVSSLKESFFIVNGLDTTLESVEVEITYFDMQRRQLHKVTETIEATIPPGETRRVDIRSWDTQKSFYFHQSAKPRRQATPFDVVLKLKSLTIRL